MKYHKLCMPLLVACLLPSTAQASSTPVSATGYGSRGVITFIGSITQPTSASVTAAMSPHADPATKTTVEPLSSAQPRLTSDLLDYFAQYAKPSAKLVSVAYQ